MLAGHETTASTLNWVLYELSRHPEFQKAVRGEIKATRAEAALRGDGELSVADLDSMKCMHALIKVCHHACGYLDNIVVETYDTGDAQVPPRCTTPREGSCSR